MNDEKQNVDALNKLLEGKTDEQKVAIMNTMFDKTFQYQLIIYLGTVLTGKDGLEAFKGDIEKIAAEIVKGMYGGGIDQYSTQVVASLIESVDVYKKAIYSDEAKSKN